MSTANLAPWLGTYFRFSHRASPAPTRDAEAGRPPHREFGTGAATAPAGGVVTPHEGHASAVSVSRGLSSMEGGGGGGGRGGGGGGGGGVVT